MFSNWITMTKELSLYVHIPFCVKKCLYCDFLSAPASEKTQEQYLHALLSEIEHRALPFSDYKIKSVFFGGGTPSILPVEFIEKLCLSIQRCFHVLPGAEWTIEVNPGTVKDASIFSRYLKSGINRVSIGLQSASNEELKKLGRIHTYEDFLSTFESAKQAGIPNLNVDLISSLPFQSLSSYKETLKKVCALHPTHISAYSLIIEEGTPFFDTYAKLINDDSYIEKDRMEYELTKELLREYGYERYEISNYSLPGYECAHNLVYWERKAYLGLGLGASSFVEDRRFKNTSDLTAYITQNGICPYEEEEFLTKEDAMAEFLFLGLRKTNGISLSDFEKCFSVPLLSVYEEVIRKNQKDGLLFLSEETGTLRLTEKGLDVSNYVFAQF